MGDVLYREDRFKSPDERDKDMPGFEGTTELLNKLTIFDREMEEARKAAREEEK